MENAICCQRIAFATSTGEEIAAMLLSATTVVLKAAIVCQVAFVNAKKDGRAAAAQKQVVIRPARMVAAA